jgi:hypothetical protein
VITRCARVTMVEGLVENHIECMCTEKKVIYKARQLRIFGYVFNIVQIDNSRAGQNN